MLICCWQDEPPSNLTDCVMRHLVISSEYDVYSSYTHPRQASKTHCRRSTVSSSSPRADPRCRRRWYLGVNRRGRVRTVKTVRRPPPMKAFFYRLWHRRRTPPTPRPPIVGPLPVNRPFATTTSPSPTTAGGRRARKKGRRKLSRRPVFPLLSYGRRRNRSRPTVLAGDSGGTAETGGDDKDCGSNLLSSCGRRRNSSEDRPTARKGRQRSRGTQRRGGQPRSILMRSV